MKNEKLNLMKNIKLNYDEIQNINECLIELNDLFETLKNIDDFNEYQIFDLIKIKIYLLKLSNNIDVKLK